MWSIEFASAEFLPVLPEECQGNPGVYGFELAWWLAQALARQGIVTSYPLDEDWGWLIEHASPTGAELTIGCGSICEAGDGYRGDPIQPRSSGAIRRRDAASGSGAAAARA